MPKASMTRVDARKISTNALPQARVVWDDGSDWSDGVDPGGAWGWISGRDDIELFGGRVELRWRHGDDDRYGPWVRVED